MIETITEEQLTPQQAEFWVRARQAVDMNNYPYAVSLLKALVSIFNTISIPTPIH